MKEMLKNLSEEIKDSNPNTDWRNISGLRDIITHRYHGIDHRLIWDIYEKKIDDLETEVDRILGEIREK